MSFELVGDACESESAGTIFAAPGDDVQWCCKSPPELSKCLAIASSVPNFACVERTSTAACIIAIKVRNIIEKLCQTFA